ncbi:hypothetical protein GUITHDRAFT_83326, partial [Guillardia theta CCMP2712]
MEQQPADTSLPILQFKEKILQEINSNTVTCIQGETGCGKSSMVPQFILDDARARRQRVNVIVSQPRRLAAVALARRVASQNNEKIGKTIGYRIGQGDHVVSMETQVTFVTIGYLLHKLYHNPKTFFKSSHVVLDEVHERGMDSDLLNLLIKKLMENSKSSTKLIIMSATLQANLFSQFFTPVGEKVRDTIFVGAKRYHVDVYFLDEWKNFHRSFMNDKNLNNLLGQFKIQNKENQGNKLKPEVRKILNKDSCTLIINLLAKIVKPDICILVFLPGIGDIESLQEDIRSSSLSSPLQILVLHSLVSREQQEAAILPATAGHCKLILSTNIAESSITIPDVLYVIDSCLSKEIHFDEKRNMPALLGAWCSQSSAKQRQGRAGRVAPGFVFHLVPRHFHDNVMLPFAEAEISRLPLEKTILKVKILLKKFGRPSALLQQSLTPPPPARFELAIKELFKVGALIREEETSPVTQLGVLASELPVDLVLVKLLVLGITCSCLPEAIVMASALSVQDIF